MGRASLAAIAAGAVGVGIAYALYRKYFRPNLRVRIHKDKYELGKAAAKFVADTVRDVVATKGYARVIVATGASQFEFIEALLKHDVPWNKVTFFHLDEYCDLPADHPASFRKYLRDRLFSKLQPAAAAVHYLDPACTDEYAAQLAADVVDLACIGIGENGHIAFNDPPPGGADFEDSLLVKRVALDEACRTQQLGEGWFPKLSDVPTHAITLTIPAIMRCAVLSCVVPDERKAAAVAAALGDSISVACPASILRQHTACTMWLDEASASLLPAAGAQ